MSSTRPIPRVSGLLLRFCLWLAVSVVVYLLLAPVYEAAVLTLSEWLLRPFLTVAVTLNDIHGVGITLHYPGIPRPMAFGYQLLSITLNAFFAPALVMTTVLAVAGWRSALLRTAAAVVIMALLHAYHVSVMILHFLVRVPNPLIAPDLPHWLGPFFAWNYGLADHMGYTLFPFIAWFGVCFRQILLLLDRLRQRQQGAQDSHETNGMGNE